MSSAAVQSAVVAEKGFDYADIEDAPALHRRVAQMLAMGVDLDDALMAQFLSENGQRITPARIRRIRNHPVIQSYVQTLREMKLFKVLDRRERFDGLLDKSLSTLEEILDSDCVKASTKVDAVKIIINHDPARTLPRQGLTQKDAKPIEVFDSDAIQQVKRMAHSLGITRDGVPRVEVVDHPVQPEPTTEPEPTEE